MVVDLDLWIDNQLMNSFESILELGEDVAWSL